VLVLLVVAVGGPWAFTGDGVGPTEWCDDPLILLENNRCVRLVPGATVLTFMVAAFFQIGVGLATGEAVLSDRGGEFFGTFLFTVGALLLVLPFFSRLLLILGRGHRRLRVFHVITWGLAGLVALLAAVSSATSGLHLALWGVWLYVALSAIALTLELLALAADSTPA
jgi:hypothetical protein